jgi:hypothetical protein
MKAKKATLATKNRNPRSKRPSRGKDNNPHDEDGGACDDGGHCDPGRAVRQDGVREATQLLEESNVANVGASDLEKDLAAMKGKPD